ncbi:ABC transporter ATP-binding protein [Bifidobacterium pseudolongum subsp. globosum]|uniref:ABC transporter ATP-binding protein n=1 Tax=Bifidobacterium pseudolongum subsp. globosum TaxID=1690 RepID=A0A2N3QHQ6_9BIFI|nr:ABC transporter ATP-binding protein [Bifidobacterium pseudolongum]PKU90841.1 ABC transporter ATP-binding protein [Bifidobacterium pseudolongum subsp. globosum]
MNTTAPIPASAAQRTAQPTPAIRVTELVKHYGDNLALDYLSMEVHRGEIYGLLGPNGSGKTTAINCILGLLTYDSGEIRIFGEPMGPTSYDLKRRIGVVPQDIAVFNELTVEENISYFCSLYVADRAHRTGLVDEAIAFVGLDDYRTYRPRKLSGGLLRRLNIACGIVHKPELIFFDEPTVAVDPQSRNAILEGIEQLNAQGSTIVYTSHYMEEVEQICDRIQIIDHGRQIALGTADELKRMIDVGERISIEAPSLTGDDDTRARSIAALRALPAVHDVAFEQDTLTVSCAQGAHNLIDVLQALRQADVPVGHVSSHTPTLNDVFLALTGTDLRD